MELETAVRLNANIVHMVWIDGTYDMVAVQEVFNMVESRESILVPRTWSNMLRPLALAVG